MRTIFRERNSRKTERFEEQIKFMDKYTSIFLRNLEAIVVIILQIFCNVCEKCLRTAYCVGCVPLNVFWYDYMNK